MTIRWPRSHLPVDVASACPGTGIGLATCKRVAARP